MSVICNHFACESEEISRICRKCHKSFCTYHKLWMDHSCVGEGIQEKKELENSGSVFGGLFCMSQSIIPSFGFFKGSLTKLSSPFDYMNYERGLSNISTKVKTIKYSSFVNKRVRSLYDDGSFIGDMTRKIVDKLETDREKVWAIYSWIGFHIRYDYAGLKNMSYMGKQREVDLVTTGIGVCDGYSTLFHTMCSTSGIKSKKITGITHESVINQIGHAWNAVIIDGKWRMIDSCWGGRKWFDIDPTIMIKTHFPTAQCDQLVVPTISKKDFLIKR
jgi:hypothetical protein